jgi:hypothetical protein
MCTPRAWCSPASFEWGEDGGKRGGAALKYVREGGGGSTTLRITMRTWTRRPEDPKSTTCLTRGFGFREYVSGARSQDPDDNVGRSFCTTPVAEDPLTLTPPEHCVGWGGQRKGRTSTFHWLPWCSVGTRVGKMFEIFTWTTSIATECSSQTCPGTRQDCVGCIQQFVQFFRIGHPLSRRRSGLG